MMQVVAGEAVRADEHAARPQYPERLGEDLVLHGQRRDVMQHGEGTDRVKGLVWVAQLRCAAQDNLDVAAGEPVRQLPGGGSIDLDRGQALDLLPQPLGRGARARAYLEHVLAEVSVLGQGWQDLILDDGRPLRARAQLRVVLVHGPDVTAGPGRDQERRLTSCVAGRTMSRGRGGPRSGRRRRNLPDARWHGL